MLGSTLKSLVIVVSLVFLALFTASALKIAAAQRTSDPVELAVLDHAARVVHGQPMYADPAAAREAAIMPGLPLAVAAIAGRLDPQLAQARAIALAGVLLIAILIALVLHLECGSWALALAGGSFALMAIDLLAATPGLARPGAPMMALVLLGFLILRYLPGNAGALFGAIPLAAAVFVDARAGFFALAAIGSLAIERNRRAATFVATAGVLVAAGYVLLSRALGPWFNFSAWDAPLDALRFSAGAPLDFVGELMLRTLGIWVTAGLLSFALETEPWFGRGGLWTWFGAAGLIATLAATQSRGFGREALLPFLVSVSLLGPAMVQRVARHLAAWKDPDEAGGENVVFAAVLLQFAAVVAAVPAARWLPDLVALWPGR